MESALSCSLSLPVARGGRFKHRDVDAQRRRRLADDFAGSVALLFPLRVGAELDLEPSLHWSDPIVVSEPHPQDGPVRVTVDYQIDPGRAAEFVRAMREVKGILRTFLVESWAEHMRQHARVTNEDRVAQDLVRSLHTGDAPPVVSHLIAHDFSKQNKRRI